MDRLDADMLVVDLISHGAPAAYTLKRVAGVDIMERGGEPDDNNT